MDFFTIILILLAVFVIVIVINKFKENPMAVVLGGALGGALGSLLMDKSYIGGNDVNVYISEQENYHIVIDGLNFIAEYYQFEKNTQSSQERMQDRTQGRPQNETPITIDTKDMHMMLIKCVKLFQDFYKPVYFVIKNPEGDIFDYMLRDYDLLITENKHIINSSNTLNDTSPPTDTQSSPTPTPTPTPSPTPTSPDTPTTSPTYKHLQLTRRSSTNTPTDTQTNTPPITSNNIQPKKIDYTIEIERLRSYRDTNNQNTCKCFMCSNSAQNTNDSKTNQYCEVKRQIYVDYVRLLWEMNNSTKPTDNDIITSSIGAISKGIGTIVNTFINIAQDAVNNASATDQKTTDQKTTDQATNQTTDQATNQTTDRKNTLEYNVNFIKNMYVKNKNGLQIYIANGQVITPEDNVSHICTHTLKGRDDALVLFLSKVIHDDTNEPNKLVFTVSNDKYVDAKDCFNIIDEFNIDVLYKDNGKITHEGAKKQFLPSTWNKWSETFETPRDDRFRVILNETNITYDELSNTPVNQNNNDTSYTIKYPRTVMLVQSVFERLFDNNKKNTAILMVKCVGRYNSNNQQSIQSSNQLWRNKASNQTRTYQPPQQRRYSSQTYQPPQQRRYSTNQSLTRQQPDQSSNQSWRRQPDQSITGGGGEPKIYKGATFNVSISQ